MFELELQQGFVFRNIISGGIAELMEEVVFDVSADGISMRSLDKAHVAMIELTLQGVEL